MHLSNQFHDTLYDGGDTPSSDFTLLQSAK